MNLKQGIRGFILLDRRSQAIIGYAMDRTFLMLEGSLD
jgi:hypothetical protein